MTLTREEELLLAVYRATVEEGGWLDVDNRPPSTIKVAWYVPGHGSQRTNYTPTLESALAEAAERLNCLPEEGEL